MKPLIFDDLARLPVLQFYEEAFRKATGVPLKIVPAQEPPGRLSLGPGENAFCALMGSTPAGCEACRAAQLRALGAAGRKLATCQIACAAGLTEVAVPVVIGGGHMATLISGQLFRREPTARDFAMVATMVGGGVNSDWSRKARKAYFETPVLTAERFQAVLQLLEVFAQYLGDHAGRQALAAAQADPPAVVSAKQYVQSHAEEPITLELVARHVHMSRFYFCKLFRKVTGMTLTDYLARVRVEKTKALLTDSSLRISEVAFAVGFGSIPQFNSVFKRHVGMAPSEYRASLRPPPPAA